MEKQRVNNIISRTNNMLSFTILLRCRGATCGTKSGMGKEKGPSGSNIKLVPVVALNGLDGGTN